MGCVIERKIYIVIIYGNEKRLLILQNPFYNWIAVWKGWYRHDEEAKDENREGWNMPTIGQFTINRRSHKNTLSMLYTLISRLLHFLFSKIPFSVFQDAWILFLPVLVIKLFCVHDNYTYWLFYYGDFFRKGHLVL